MKCKTKTSTKDVTRFMNKKGKPMLKGSCCRCKTTKTQLLPQKEGGFVFTLPMLAAAAAAAGSLAGGASTIATAVNQKKNSDKVLAETKRHNKAMESKNGQGLYLKPYKGRGLYVRPYKV